MSDNPSYIASPRDLAAPERFAGYRGDIEDEPTARRIQKSLDWNAQHMADRICDVNTAASKFANAVFNGEQPDFDDLHDTLDVAMGAMYDWGKNNARITAWKEQGANNG